MNPDCVLVYPRPTQDSPKKQPALSIFFPGAMLEKAGYEVEYVDERFESFSRVSELLATKPLAVGVSAMTGFQLAEAQRILTAVKQCHPGIATIMGGVHASLLPKQTLSETFVDFVVVGEGEDTLVELIGTLKEGGDFHPIKGLGWKQQGKIVVNPARPFINLAHLPFPLTLKTRVYFEIAAKSGEMMYPTSRGCPHRCSFCYNKIFNRGRWRPLPLDKWEKDIDLFVAELGFNRMETGDDNIGRNKNRILHIGRVMQRHGIEWDTDIRPDYIDEKMIRILEEGGCRSVFFGIESGSERILQDIINKELPQGVEDLKRCARLMGQSQVKGIYSFMCNIPTQTKEELNESLALADYIAMHDPKSRISFYVYAPYPGTSLYETAINNGFREPKNMEEWSKITLSNPINPLAESIYYISGLRFRGKKGDNTNRNFPGLLRLLILPFELSARFRWKFRLLSFYGVEKSLVKRLFRWASNRLKIN